MKKNVKKILVSVLLSATMVSSLGAIPAFAESYPPSTSNPVDGVTAYASIAYTKNSSGVANGVVATTTYSPVCYMSATATACYKVGKEKKYTPKVTRTNTAGGVSATASADGLGTMLGGQGVHVVKRSGNTWEAITQIGEF